MLRLLSRSAENIFDVESHDQYLVHISSDGSAVWAPGGVFFTSCQLDMTLYPFDHQTCDLVFGSWMYSNVSLQLRNGSNRIGLNKYSRDGEWELTSTEVSHSDLFYEGLVTESFPMVTYRLNIRRKVTYYVMNLIIPCLLMSLLEALVFLMPPDSGEKVALGITILLSYFVFLLLVVDNVPQSSDAVPLIGKNI